MFILFYVWVFCLYVLGAFRSQKSASDPPELVLQTVVNSRPVEEQVLLITNHLSSPCFILCVCVCCTHVPQFQPPFYLMYVWFLARVLSRVCVSVAHATVPSLFYLVCVCVLHTRHSSFLRSWFWGSKDKFVQGRSHLSCLDLCVLRVFLLLLLFYLCLFESGPHYIVLAVLELGSKPDLPLPLAWCPEADCD